MEPDYGAGAWTICLSKGPDKTEGQVPRKQGEKSILLTVIINIIIYYSYSYYCYCYLLSRLNIQGHGSFLRVSRVLPILFGTCPWPRLCKGPRSFNASTLIPPKRKVCSPRTQQWPSLSGMGCGVVSGCEGNPSLNPWVPNRKR